MNIVLPANARKAIYLGLVLVGLAIGAVSAGFGPNTPDWFDIATRIFGFIVAAPATLALLNINSSDELLAQPAPDNFGSEHSDDSSDGDDVEPVAGDDADAYVDATPINNAIPEGV